MAFVLHLEDTATQNVADAARGMFDPAQVSSGSTRVEDGHGGLGHMANAPFPILAHRTGRADLRHPALRLASARGTHDGAVKWPAFEAQQAAFSVDNFAGEPDCPAPCHLVPSGEEVTHALVDGAVDSTECRTACAATCERLQLAGPMVFVRILL